METGNIESLMQQVPDDLTDEEVVQVFTHLTNKVHVSTTSRFVEGMAQVLWIFNDGLGPYSRGAMISSIIERRFDTLTGGAVPEDFDN